MNAQDLMYVIDRIQSDKEHHRDRRNFHENYEWLEHFWRYKYKKGDNSIDDFITQKGQFYWNIKSIRVLAKEFASIECVGSNKDPDYAQTLMIAQATMYLRYICNLYDKDTPTCDTISCREHKIRKGHCTKSNALLWKKDFDPVFAFRALMFIVRQVRNNLFHGHKISVEPDLFKRNKVLVELSAQVTEVLLTNLFESER